MAKFIENDFSKELSKLLTKHKKTIESDKSGIYIVDNANDIKILLSEPTTSSEDYRTGLYFIFGIK